MSWPERSLPIKGKSGPEPFRDAGEMSLVNNVGEHLGVAAIERSVFSTQSNDAEARIGGKAGREWCSAAVAETEWMHSNRDLRPHQWIRTERYAAW